MGHTKYVDRSAEKLLEDQKRLRPNGTKKCSTCPGEKPLEDFARNPLAPDGRNSLCNKCHATYSAEREKILRKRTSKKIRDYQKQVYGSDLSLARKPCGGKCGRKLPLSCFTSNLALLDGLCRACKNCNGKQTKQRWLKMLELRTRLKSVGCSRCKWTGPACALDFAHREAKEKRKNKHGKRISPGGLMSEEAVLAEAEKCDVLCANCHHIDTQNAWIANLSQTKDAIRKRSFVESRKPWIEKEKRARGKCADCGLLVANFPTSLFDFDHKVGSEKILPVSTMMEKGRYKREDIENEMKKCDLRCKRCHRIKTQERRDAKKAKKVDNDSKDEKQRDTIKTDLVTVSGTGAEQPQRIDDDDDLSNAEWPSPSDDDLIDGEWPSPNDDDLSDAEWPSPNNDDDEPPLKRARHNNPTTASEHSNLVSHPAPATSS